MKFLLACFLLFGSIAQAERSFVVKKDGVSIHVIEFGKEENAGFKLIDGGKRKNFISEHYSPEQHVFFVNGGYFDGNLNPVGYCRIDGENQSTVKNAKLSGFVTITKQGKLSLHWKELPEMEYTHIVQAGPFVIDPGGSVGIHGRSGGEAKRTLIGQTEDGKIVVLTTTEVYLYDLARILKSEFSELERVLNLDGGPSVGLIYNDIRIENTSPVRNFITKLKSGGVNSEAAPLHDTP